jgi:hypothetical protein
LFPQIRQQRGELPPSRALIYGSINLASHLSQYDQAHRVISIQDLSHILPEDRTGLSGLARPSGRSLWPVKDQAAAWLMTEFYETFQQPNTTQIVSRMMKVTVPTLVEKPALSLGCFDLQK